MKPTVLTILVISAISPCLAFAQADDTPFASYMELSTKAMIVGDTHNAEIYEDLAIMKREADGDPDYNWTEFKKLKAQLKNRKNKPFNKKAVEFFKARCNSDETRVCYVIDFSASMKGKRIDLLRKELTHSISHLPEDSQFSAIFFAGPVWHPGENVKKVNGSKQHVIVSSEFLDSDWKGEGAHTWKSDQGPAPTAWQFSDPTAKRTIAAQIEKQPLVWGTDWSNPLAAALQLDPLPDVIYFMTDGSCKTAKASAIAIAAEAKAKGVRINSIAMMEPKAERPMKYMAAETGGDFVVITKAGECELHEDQHLESPDLEEKHDHDKKDKKKGKRNAQKKKQKKARKADK